MSSIRLIAGQVLAGLAVILALLNDSGETSSLGLPLMTVGISAFILALAAFFITVEKGSVAIAGLLTLQGAANSYAAYMAGVNFGIYFGLMVLALGVLKFGVTLWSRTKGGPGSPERASGIGSQRAAISKVAALVVLVVVAAVAAWVVLLVIPSAGPSPNPCSTSTGQGAVGSTVQISIYDGATNSANPPGYAPDAVTLVIGVNNTVTWTNNDSAAHTVTSTSAPACGSFNSGNMAPGATYTRTFMVPGTYEYRCNYHSWMTGTVVVEASPES